MGVQPLWLLVSLRQRLGYDWDATVTGGIDRSALRAEKKRGCGQAQRKPGYVTVGVSALRLPSKTLTRFSG